MSRFDKSKSPTPDAGTPIWVWIVYALGLLAGTILLLSIGWVVVVSMSSSEDASYTVNISSLALALWVGLVVLAAGTLLWRRRNGGR